MLRIIVTWSILVWAGCLTLGTAAAQDVRLAKLSNADLDFMQAQREIIMDLSTRHLGERISGARARDLHILQTLLDRNLVKPQQTRELQAMGVILGDLLADELGMDWVIYEDKLGRSRALRYGDSDTYLFPITMISRRREAANLKPVTEIYQKARDIAAASIPPLPFQ